MKVIEIEERDEKETESERVDVRANVLIRKNYQ